MPKKPAAGPWNVRLPKVDDDIIDPKIHKKAYKVIHGESRIICKLGDACTCRASAYYEVSRMFACNNAVAKDGIWTHPWALRFPVTLVCLGVGWMFYKRLSPKKEKMSGYHPDTW